MNPQLQKLSKETLQKIAMGVIAAVAVGFCSYYFLLAPLWTEIDALNQSIAEQQKVLAQNQALKASGGKVAVVYRETADRLLAMMKNQMPPAVNPLAWSTDYLKNVTSKSGVREAGTVPFVSTSGADPVYEEYFIRTNLFCSFHELGMMLCELEKGNKLIRIDSLDIAPAEKEAAENLSTGLRLAFIRFSEKKFPAEERPLADEKGAAFLPRHASALAENAAPPPP